jgi:hypothetical protein
LQIRHKRSYREHPSGTGQSRNVPAWVPECAWYLYFGSKATRSVTIALLETASLGLAVMESEEYNPDYSKSKSMSEQASAAADSNIIQAFIVDDRLYFNTVSDCHELQLSKDSLFSLLDDFSNHINKKLFSFTDINLPNFEQESPVGLLKEYIRASFGTIQCRE